MLVICWLFFPLRYLDARRDEKKWIDRGNKTKIISMSLYGGDPKYTYGALRNAQLQPVIFPGWTLRIYIEKPNEKEETKYEKVPEKILAALRKLGAQIVQVCVPSSQH